jgi:ribose 5-phosphate isomerase B
MKVSIASDHAGFELKNKVIEKLKIKGYEVVDCGCFSKEVANGSVDFGVGVCSSGVGVAIVANKVKGVRAAQVWNKEMAKLCRAHNNANFISISDKFTVNGELDEILEIFFHTPFEGGRHLRRVNKIENK